MTITPKIIKIIIIIMTITIIINMFYGSVTNSEICAHKLHADNSINIFFVYTFKTL